MSTKEQQREYYATNPDKFRNKSKKFRENNLESARSSVRKWHKNHPEEVKRLNRESYHRGKLKDPELSKKKNRIRKLWTKYRLTPEKEQQMIAEQDSCCKICRRHISIVGRLVPDHNHKTKRVRSMLCNGCNRGLGQFEENVQRMENAIAYIQEDQCHVVV